MHIDIDGLRSRLKAPLPGSEAQDLMSPKPRSPLNLRYRREQARPAAVVALLYQESAAAVDHARLLLTKRAEHLSKHANQICLPGGAIDPGETAWDTACRELEEEVGIGREQIQALGPLSPVFVPVSGFEIQPFVGHVHKLPPIAASSDEVAEVIEIPVQALLATELRRQRVEWRGEIPVEIPYFQFADVEVWGATAMILSELAVLLGYETPT